MKTLPDWEVADLAATMALPLNLPSYPAINANNKTVASFSCQCGIRKILVISDSRTNRTAAVPTSEVKELTQSTCNVSDECQTTERYIIRADPRDWLLSWWLISKYCGRTWPASRTCLLATHCAQAICVPRVASERHRMVFASQRPGRAPRPRNGLFADRNKTQKPFEHIMLDIQKLCAHRADRPCPQVALPAHI